jgi:hypothetical protein
MKMKTPVISRLLAMAVMVVFAALSFSALAGWSLTPAEVVPSGTPEPFPLLLIGIAVTAAGVFLRGSR